MGHKRAEESKPRIVLTYGEDPQREALAVKIRERWPGVEALRPQLGESITV